MLTNALVVSKFFRPVLSRNGVKRDHLVAKLDEGLSIGRQVSLISAPAGYGKSTLVAQWISHAKYPVAWLSLEEADDDPLRFFTYFIAALQQVDKTFGAELSQVLEAGQLPPSQILITTLVNNLAGIKATSLCVLDDFQFIQDKKILIVLQELVAHQPHRLHLVISTREDPALPIARWRGRNQLTEIRAADLRFSDEEVGCFLREGMGLNLSTQDICILGERTEGWVVGLQLAGISLKGRENPAAFVESLSGSHRFILGYLTEEVLKNQPKEVQDFLLQTSILSKLNGSLCNAVTGKKDNTPLLENLLASNLFIIPLDDEGNWYRYHHLFADLLSKQLCRDIPEKVTELHLRASQWYEDQKMPTEAIEHALAAKDFACVSRLLEQSGWDLLNQGSVRKMETWMQSIPGEWRVNSPRTCLSFAWMYMLRSNFGQAAAYLKQAESALENLPDSLDLQAECFALQANLMQSQGKIADSLDAARQAQKLAAPDNFRVIGLAALGMGAAYRQTADFEKAAEALEEAIRISLVSGNLVTEMLAVSHLTSMALQYGRLHFAANTASQFLQRLEPKQGFLPPIMGAIYGALGLVYLEWNQLKKAHEYFDNAIRLGTFSGHSGSVSYSKVNLAHLFQIEGDIKSAEIALSEADELIRAGAPAWVRSALINRQVNLLLAQGNPAAAETVLIQSDVVVGDNVTQQTDLIHLAWLRLLNYQKKDQTTDLARRIIASADSNQRNGTLLQALVLGTISCSYDSNLRQKWLARAVELAESEGCLRVFLDEGSPLAILLRQEGYSKFLVSLPEISQPTRKIELIEQLSDRELEVLHLLAEGLKYSEIADRLVVSINTIRYHVKGIYGKLNVDRLSMAIERARELSLLE